jgi:hypothetical protein
VLEFIEFPAFTSRLQALPKKNAGDVLLEIQNDLLANPNRGAVIPGTGGVRKARAADPARGKGKSGGFRYLYHYIEQDGQIYLLMIFSKNEQDGMTKAQKDLLAQHVRDLREAK